MLQNCGIDAHRRLSRLLTRLSTCYGAQYILHLVSPLYQNRRVLSVLILKLLIGVITMELSFPPRPVHTKYLVQEYRTHVNALTSNVILNVNVNLWSPPHYNVVAQQNIIYSNLNFTPISILATFFTHVT